MKVTYNWLKGFVEIRILPKALADKLTMAGLEVKALEEKYGDTVFEIEITSNRPDWLSVVGIAREIAAITNKKLRAYSVERRAYSKKLSAKRYPLNAKTLEINIENKKDCPLYTAKIIRDVQVAESPEWLKQRLELIGCRSINNIVDITNYVLFESGQPLHAFDLDKIQRTEIVVRRARAGEKIVTIDGQEKVLSQDILVIADKNRPLALAGIVGGKDTEVDEGTKNILLEAAVFDPVLVRRGRQKLGLQSESAYRFERGIDGLSTSKLSSQAAQLICELAKGTFVCAKSSGVIKETKKTVSLNTQAAQDILGIKIAPAKTKSVLSNLGFTVKPKGKNNFQVTVPSFRQDVKIEADLIEEISRIFGYARIPVSLAKVRLERIGQDSRSLVSRIKDMLTGLGLNEVITYSLIDRDLLRKFNFIGANPVEISNPLSREQEILRPALMPSLVKCIAYNLNQKQDAVSIFEIAKTFAPEEKLTLGIALCGIKSHLFFEEGAIKEKIGLLHLKGALEAVFERLQIKDYELRATENINEAALYVNKERAGTVMTLEKKIAESLDIKNKDVAIAELDLDKVLDYADFKRRFIPLPMYPGISRDISIILKEGVSVDEVLKEVKDTAGPLLKEVKVADFYKGRQIPAGFKSLTLSCFYRCDERTLTDEEVNLAHSASSSALAEKFGAKIR